MTLTDAGPLYALVNKREKMCAACRSEVTALPKPLLTTWPCFTEAMYLADSAGGWPMQRLLWDYVASRVVAFHALSEADTARMQALMEQYRDTPMDLADASLVAAAEATGITRVFTLDSHFHAYRVHGTTPFEVVPAAPIR